MWKPTSERDGSPVVGGAAGAVGGPLFRRAQSAGPRHALLLGATVALVATPLAAARLDAHRAPRAVAALAA